MERKIHEKKKGFMGKGRNKMREYKGRESENRTKMEKEGKKKERKKVRGE